jgi:ATP-binding protein involved in chromosome partitioning
VPLLGQVPLEVAIRQGGDDGVPVMLGSPDSPAARALAAVADALAARQRSLVGRSLGLSAASR